jgi:hypothetical protein
MGVEWARGEGIYKASKQWTPGPRGIRSVLLHSGPKVVLYVYVLPSGQSKK